MSDHLYLREIAHKNLDTFSLALSVFPPHTSNRSDQVDARSGTDAGKLHSSELSLRASAYKIQLSPFFLLR